MAPALILSMQHCLLWSYAQIRQLGASVYGLSTQSTEYQREVVSRLHLPYTLLSDPALCFIHAFSLPTFEASGQTLAKRVTLVCRDRKIEKVFYPVFPRIKTQTK